MPWLLSHSLARPSQVHHPPPKSLEPLSTHPTPRAQLTSFSSWAKLSRQADLGPAWGYLYVVPHRSPHHKQTIPPPNQGRFLVSFTLRNLSCALPQWFPRLGSVAPWSRASPSPSTATSPMSLASVPSWHTQYAFTSSYLDCSSNLVPNYQLGNLGQVTWPSQVLVILPGKGV